ncbi:hypothetical protein Leryth_014102 [Lithospermum erythrorhizon]|nr:hypothetical protein Leryth_014102 [Lithospermum erythrorhizon]
MDQNKAEIAKDFPPFFRVHKNGLIDRYIHTDFIPPSQHPQTLVQSKDVIISQQNKLSARIYLPKSAFSNNHTRKFPLLIYIHGGAFSVQSPFSSIYHTYLNNLVSESEVIAVSVDYRLAPENPLPACYDDAWSVFNWVFSHSGKKIQDFPGPGKPEKPEPWLSDHVDYTRVFLAGDSAGANIAHDLLVRASSKNLKLEGMILIHPFFGNGKKADKLWEYIYPGTSGVHDPRLNPAAHVNLLKKLACKRIMICVAEEDELRKRGWYYYESVKRSGWNGEVEIVETKGESHVFHLLDPCCENAGIFMKQVASFINKIGFSAL